jgi:molybdate transport system substrate-binding protein
MKEARPLPPRFLSGLLYVGCCRGVSAWASGAPRTLDVSCFRTGCPLYSSRYNTTARYTVMLMERRAFLRWLPAVGLGGISLAIGTAASRAQHQQHAAPPVSRHDTSHDNVSHDGAATLVFAAATLKPALDEVMRAFEAAGGAKVNIAYGPGPILAKNIMDGAPADVFFSADTLWMDYLAERKLIRDDTRVDVVRNEVVLVRSEKGAPAIKDGQSEKDRAATVDAAFPIAGIVGAGPIAMCNPESHPAGRYGRLRLQEQHLWDAIASKVAIVENPQVAALMVGRGDATSAVVFATDVHGIGGVRIVGTFPGQAQSPIVYPAAVTAGAPHPERARHLLMFLRSPQARGIFDGYGYR